MWLGSEEALLGDGCCVSEPILIMNPIKGGGPVVVSKDESVIDLRRNDGRVSATFPYYDQMLVYIAEISHGRGSSLAERPTDIPRYIHIYLLYDAYV